MFFQGEGGWKKKLVGVDILASVGIRESYFKRNALIDLKLQGHNDFASKAHTLYCTANGDTF